MQLIKRFHEIFQIAKKIMKNFKIPTFSYDFMIPGSRHFNPGISGLENLSESRDFGIGIVPGFIPRTGPQPQVMQSFH